MREIADYEDIIGNGYQFTALDDYIKIEIHSDWAGSSETGFGESCSFEIYDVNLVKEIVILLVNWITLQEKVKEGIYET